MGRAAQRLYFMCHKKFVLTLPFFTLNITSSSDEESTDSDESFYFKMCKKHVDVQHISTQTVDFMNEN